MQFISVLIGIFAFVWMVLGMIPFLGWIQWPVLVLCTLGIIFGAFAKRKVGLTINLVIGAVAALRAILGGGLF
jgi:hypothetical protein